MPYLELNLELSDEHMALKEATHKFARDVLRPASIKLDKIADPAEVIRHPLYWETMKKGFELGYHTIFLPDNYGGLGLDALGVHIVLEELGWGSADFAIGLGVCSFPAFFASMAPNDRLENEIIRPFCECRDASIIGCWAITEPNHGTDMLQPGTPGFSDPAIRAQVQARIEGDEVVISGQKSAWVSNGTVATHALVYLQMEPTMGMAGGGIAIVPLNLPGVSKGAPLDKMGQRALNQGEIFFDDVRIPKDYLLVDPESYEGMVDITLATANAGMGAIFTGTARAAYDEALSYAKTRVQGGKTLFDHQLIKHKLFNMFMKIEASRALSRSVWVYNANTTPPVTRYSIASKVFGTQTAFDVASEAVQIHGGYGVTKEYTVEKLFRDARAAMIEDGANDSLMITGAHAL
jgi:alkylation response protein AidB-like acyl-CoA dehydrogenase